MAKLYFRYGAMNCGKSTALLQVNHNYKERGMKTFLLKPKIDTKGENLIVSRLGASIKVDHLLNKNENVFNIIKDQVVDCILVDEAQFLTKDQVNQLSKIATLKNIPVLCYGLRTDFLENGFEGSTRLLEIADSLTELKTICRCGSKATCNMRLVNGTPMFAGEQVAIDLNNEKVSYESFCKNCYYKAKGEYHK